MNMEAVHLGPKSRSEGGPGLSFFAYPDNMKVMFKPSNIGTGLQSTRPKVQVPTSPNKDKNGHKPQIVIESDSSHGKLNTYIS